LIGENMFKKCPKCGWSMPKYLENISSPYTKYEIAWAYTPTENKDKWHALKKARIRAEIEKRRLDELEILEKETKATKGIKTF
tara:strand:+ start:1240 stop:1488 length:249 start_codon:yes stop_codon:yes gene_type:complete